MPYHFSQRLFLRAKACRKTEGSDTDSAVTNVTGSSLLNGEGLNKISRINTVLGQVSAQLTRVKWKSTGSATVILALLFVMAFAASGHAQRTVRIGVASMITPVEAVKYYQDIVDYIGERLGIPVEMVHRRTYDEMDKLLEKGHVQAAFICSAPYVKNRRAFGVELLVAPEVRGSVFYHSYIIVHRDSPIKSFEDLRGKTFAFTDPKSNSGRLYPVYILARMGYRPEKFFSRYIYSYSHNKSIELVAKRKVDAAAVESLVYEYMKLKGSPYVFQTKVIDKSPPFGIPPFVVSPKTPLFVKEKLKEILLNMHKDPKGRTILQQMFIDRFVEVPDSNYDSIRKMEAFVEAFYGRKEHNPSKNEKIIRFGVIPRDNPRISFEKYQPLIDYLSEVTGLKIELTMKRTYEETIVALGSGEIDLALLSPLSYLEARARYGAVAVLRSVTEDGRAYYRSVIVTKEDSPVEKLSDLKGRSMAFASLMSTAGNLYPRYMLAWAGLHLKDLSDYKNFNYHDTVVKWVLRGRFDAGAVRQTVAEKYLPLGLRIIARSEPIPTGPIVVGPRTPYRVVEKIKEALLRIKEAPSGREALKKADPELRGGFIPASDSDYKGIRKLINDVPRTCGTGCHPKIKL